MCRFSSCHPLSCSGQLAGPLEVVQFAVPRHVPRRPAIYRAAFHSQYVPRPARPSAGTSTDTGKSGFPPPCTDRAWQVWWCGGWMSLAATALRWLRTGTGDGQASTSPHGGASGAAPSLTPCTATAFLRSCPTVAQEASSLARPVSGYAPGRRAGVRARQAGRKARLGCRHPGGLQRMRYPFHRRLNRTVANSPDPNTLLVQMPGTYFNQAILTSPSERTLRFSAALPRR